MTIKISLAVVTLVAVEDTIETLIKISHTPRVELPKASPGSRCMTSVIKVLHRKLQELLSLHEYALLELFITFTFPQNLQNQSQFGYSFIYATLFNSFSN